MPVGTIPEIVMGNEEPMKKVIQIMICILGFFFITWSYSAHAAERNSRLSRDERNLVIKKINAARAKMNRITIMIDEAKYDMTLMTTIEPSSDNNFNQDSLGFEFNVDQKKEYVQKLIQIRSALAQSVLKAATEYGISLRNDLAYRGFASQ